MQRIYKKGMLFTLIFRLMGIIVLMIGLRMIGEGIYNYINEHDQDDWLTTTAYVVGSAVEEPVTPVKAQPVDILLDGLHELHILLGGIGVVHAEIADAAVFFCSTEVDDQGLAVSDVQIAVGFRGKTGMDSLTGAAAALGNVLVNKSLDEIFAFGDFSHSWYILSCRSWFLPNNEHIITDDTEFCNQFSGPDHRFLRFFPGQGVRIVNFKKSNGEIKII